MRFLKFRTCGLGAMMIGPTQYEANCEFILSESQAATWISVSDINDGYVVFEGEVYHPPIPELVKSEATKPEVQESREVVGNIIEAIEIVMA